MQDLPQVSRFRTSPPPGSHHGALYGTKAISREYFYVPVTMSDGSILQALCFTHVKRLHIIQRANS